MQQLLRIALHAGMAHQMHFLIIEGFHDFCLSLVQPVPSKKGPLTIEKKENQYIIVNLIQQLNGDVIKGPETISDVQAFIIAPCGGDFAVIWPSIEASFVRDLSRLL